MKKATVLILGFLLCISLSACGGISGEKAAGLYPDIVGDWGTDPFGEEFILCLAEDGTCTVFANPGTWTLDEKHSSAERVTLTAKTEHVTYNIQLDRQQDKKQNKDDSVSLLITDSKQKITVYEGNVFTQANHFISADLALQTVPELVDVWGSPYWYEEPALTIREDGTCTVLRQPGRWCLRSSRSTWPRIDILIKLDSGKQLYADFYLRDAPDSYMGSLDIYDSATGIPVFPIDFISNISTPFVISRTRAPVASEFASVVIGTWAVEGKSTEPVATFNENGTCSIRGADGIWTLEYNNLHNYISNEYWELEAKIQDNAYMITLQGNGSGQYYMSIYNKGMEILPMSKMAKIPGN